MVRVACFQVYILKLWAECLFVTITTFTLQISYNKYKTLIVGERNNITGNEQGL